MEDHKAADEGDEESRAWLVVRELNTFEVVKIHDNLLHLFRVDMTLNLVGVKLLHTKHAILAGWEDNLYLIGMRPAH